jgi:hypothetical protein
MTGFQSNKSSVCGNLPNFGNNSMNNHIQGMCIHQGYFAPLNGSLTPIGNNVSLSAIMNMSLNDSSRLSDCGSQNQHCLRKGSSQRMSVNGSECPEKREKWVEDLLAQVAQVPYIWYPKTHFSSSDEFVLWIAGETNLTTQQD